jgi:endo-1,4-beta-xylanase
MLVPPVPVWFCPLSLLPQSANMMAIQETPTARIHFVLGNRIIGLLSWLLRLLRSLSVTPSERQVGTKSGCTLDTSTENGEKTGVMRHLQSPSLICVAFAVVAGSSGCGDDDGGIVPRDAAADVPLRIVDGDVGGIDCATAIDGDGEPECGAGGVGVDGAVTPVTLATKFVGNIDTRGAIRSDFATYWNQYTPENAGKWGSVQPTSRDAFNWTRLDASYQYCREHGILFKQHNFVWGSQQPGWTGDLTADDGPAVVQTWMKEFCTRYPDTKVIDVVNEPPPHTTPKYMDAIGGAGNTGWDWIVNAFTWARQACPDALLVLNDYSNIENGSDAQHTIDIVKVLQKAGAPVGAVGCQAHWALNVSADNLKANIDKIAAETGLPVYITEYDLDTSDDAKQAQVMQDQFTMFWENGNVKGVTLWGYVVGSTWQPNTGLLRADGTMRPAMSWLMSFLGR